MFLFSMLLDFGIGYFCGSLTFSLWIPLLFGQKDPRTHGSGNLGATNVWRLSGYRLGLLVFFLDMAKSFLPVLCAPNEVAAWTIGLGSVCGHMFPYTSHWKGGKGIATGIGIIFALHPWIGISSMLLWLGMCLLFRYVSLASLSTTLLLFFFLLYQGSWIDCLGSLCLTGLIFWGHRMNIQRLWLGQEPKMMSKRCQ